MNNPVKLRDLAVHALRPARDIGIPDVAATLRATAAEYTRLTDEMDAEQADLRKPE